MNNKKYTIELGFEELCLIERALELYGRVGMLQFDYLTLCSSLQNLIWKKNLYDEFDFKADELKAVFDYPANSNPGVFNTTDVEDDCRIALDIYQTIRHERYLQRIESGEQTENHYTVDESPADICDIAKLKSPDFHIKCKELVESRL